MKAPFLFILLLLTGVFRYAEAQGSLHFQVVDRLRIRGLLKQSETDSVMKTERLAALKFHILINQYRKENKLDTICFSDTLWLASRNHCVWMYTNDQLNHIEEENTPSFTGEDPGDRYDFVTNKKGNCNWTGENILYSYTWAKTIEEIATDMASSSFSTWQASPGHNA
ncbi:MAG: CAP domain-containing protein, partial [Bacteroidia bacterium]